MSKNERIEFKYNYAVHKGIEPCMLPFSLQLPLIHPGGRWLLNYFLCLLRVKAIPLLLPLFAANDSDEFQQRQQLGVIPFQKHLSNLSARSYCPTVTYM